MLKLLGKEKYPTPRFHFSKKKVATITPSCWSPVVLVHGLPNIALWEREQQANICETVIGNVSSSLLCHLCKTSSLHHVLSQYRGLPVLGKSQGQGLLRTITLGRLMSHSFSSTSVHSITISQQHACK